MRRSIFAAALVFATAACRDGPPKTCGPASITLDGAPMQLDHGALGFRQDDTWEIHLFASGTASDGIHASTDVSCPDLLESRLGGADYIAITSFGNEVGGLAYSLSTPMAVGISFDPKLGSCRDGAPCNRIGGSLVETPAVAGDPIAMCVSAKVTFSDSTKVSHDLVIEGRVRGSHCGTKR